MAFGCLLDGPSPAVLEPIIKEAAVFLMKALGDPHPCVRDTTAWAMGRVFEFIHEHCRAMFDRNNMPQIVALLCERMADRPHIVYRVCRCGGSGGKHRNSLGGLLCCVFCCW